MLSLCFKCISTYIVSVHICVYVYGYILFIINIFYIFLFMLLSCLDTESDNEVNRLPSPASGFHIPENGIISQIDSTKEKPGIYCQNDAHFGSFNNVTVNAQHCDSCLEYGAPVKTTHDCWSLPEELPPIITSEDDIKPIFLLALVSRSSSGAAIPQVVFDNLRGFIDTYQR
jgi:hypothetical protein